MQLAMGGANQVMVLNGAHRHHLLLTLVTTVGGVLIAYPICMFFGANGIGVSGLLTVGLYYAYILIYTKRRDLPVTWLFTKRSDWSALIISKFALFRQCKPQEDLKEMH
jgi:membrane protein CcdC involved in cytochrome C biogenesis